MPTACPVVGLAPEGAAIDAILAVALAIATLLATMIASIWLLCRWARWLDARLIVYPPRSVTSGDRKLRVTDRDARAASELLELTWRWNEARDANPAAGKSVLLAARPLFREIGHSDTAAGLIFSTQSQFPELIRLAIWLLGRSRGTLGAATVATFSQHDDVRMRREVARALRRMRAWCELAPLLSDSDPQVRSLAAVQPPEDFRARLAALTASGLTVAQASSAAGPMPLVWNVPPDAGQRPRAAQWFRQILERIQQLLRGEARSH